VAADDPTARRNGIAGAIGVLNNLPAKAMDEVMMVDKAVHVQVLERGLAALTA
jgi:hypothetical protein